MNSEYELANMIQQGFVPDTCHHVRSVPSCHTLASPVACLLPPIYTRPRLGEADCVATRIGNKQLKSEIGSKDNILDSNIKLDLSLEY
jgi:hypothetical protein